MKKSRAIARLKHEQTLKRLHANAVCTKHTRSHIHSHKYNKSAMEISCSFPFFAATAALVVVAMRNNNFFLHGNDDMGEHTGWAYM